MATLSTQPNPLKWTGGYYAREALWPMEPDVVIISSLALRHLASKLPDILDPESMEVQFFAQGGFNKLYSISYPGHPTKYLLRVALPIVPYYRIESEAAVLSYLKENTSIPVARVIDWDSSAANDLGFEWILLEKIEGITLYEVWRKIPWDLKLELVAALAPLLGQLRDHVFDHIGSLYFKGREIQPNPKFQLNNAPTIYDPLINGEQTAQQWRSGEDCDQRERRAGGVIVTESDAAVVQEQDTSQKFGKGTLSTGSATASHWPQPANVAVRCEKPTLEEESEQNRYVVGQLLDPLFFLYRRLYLLGDRGPSRTSQEWMAAEIDFQMHWIRTGPLVRQSPNRDDFDDDDWDSDCDEEAPDMEKLCHDFQHVLHEIFPAREETSSYVLYHHDLSLANILVDPGTLKITGVIDWETIQVGPKWKTSRFPKFLTDQMDFEEIDDEEPRIPTPVEYDEESEHYNAVVVERRDRWDNKILRQNYDEVLSRTRGERIFTEYTSDSAATKRKFEALTMKITEDTHHARKWLDRYSQSEGVGTESK
ncbi:hypothetical protein MMC28_003655 [Mycoblastus sanguinarius]|nr:hypothetical protein [Mycoblastus sanguinarius]